MKDLVVGTGRAASRNSQVVVQIRGFLNRGELVIDSFKYGQPIRIELSKRDWIAGLRYGIEGMQAGGVRELIVSPHLAYGADGLTGIVPPNAVIRFKVELFEVRDAGEFKDEDYPSSKHLYFLSPGEAARNRPRCQYGLEENGRCGVSLTIPQPGTTWRHTRHQTIEKLLSVSEAAKMLDEAASIPQLHPDVCLNNDFLWADASEKANSITRQINADLPCATIGVRERNVWLCYYSLPETSPVLRESNLFNLIAEMVSPFFAL